LSRSREHVAVTAPLVLNTTVSDSDDDVDDVVRDDADEAAPERAYGLT
jgi:hypothetical protein